TGGYRARQVDRGNPMPRVVVVGGGLVGLAAAMIPAAPPAAPPGQDDGGLPGLAEMQVAMLYDPDVFRAFLEIISLRALPEDIMVRPGFSEYVAKAAADREAVAMPGPSRGDLLRSLA